jgi:hypothetical protein
VHGKGKINIASTFGKIKIIIDFFNVLGLTKNLLSIGMIINKGNNVIFYFHKCLVIHNDDPYIIVAKGVRDPKNRLYKLEVPSVKSSTQIVSTWAIEVNKW